MQEAAERSTLAHYDQVAEQFWLGTREHDVSQNIAALLSALPAERPLKILDLGCGPGRDLIQFTALGHHAVGLDGSESFCQMARENSGCTVLKQSFLELDLGEAEYDGIFANASLFHVPRPALPEVLRHCHRSLVEGGVLFSSNPRGNREGWNGQRYGNYMEYDESAERLHQAGFEIIEHYYRPAGLPRSQQPWLAIVARKC